MRLALPAQVTTSADPLLVTGPCDSQGDFVSIVYPYAGQIAFGYLQPRLDRTAQSPVRRPPRHRGHTVEIDMPSLYPAETDDYFAARTVPEIVDLKRPQLRLRMDGAVAFNARVPSFDSTADQIELGENRLSAVYGPHFTGKILSVERSTFARPAGLDANPGALELVVILPAAGHGKETVLATGPGTAPDALVLSAEGPNRYRFAALAADGRSVAGENVTLDPAAKHTLVVQWGGLYPDGEQRRPVALSVDGQTVLSGRLDFNSPTRSPSPSARPPPSPPPSPGESNRSAAYPSKPLPGRAGPPRPAVRPHQPNPFTALTASSSKAN